MNLSATLLSMSTMIAELNTINSIAAKCMFSDGFRTESLTNYFDNCSKNIEIKQITKEETVVLFSMLGQNPIGLNHYNEIQDNIKDLYNMSNKLPYEKMQIITRFKEMKENIEIEISELFETYTRIYSKRVK